MPLNAAQQALHDAVFEGRNVFITGPAGTGKSFLLRQLVDDLEEHNPAVYVTASTGIAAMNVGGSTVHSYLGTRFCNNIHQLKLLMQQPSIQYNRKLKNRLRNTDILIVDEVSMLSGDYVEMMHYWLCHVRDNDLPFGGVRMVFCGDFMQLPPVLAGSDRIPTYRYAFQAPAWQDAELFTGQLRECFRQEDIEFVHMLLEIRAGKVSETTLAALQPCVKRELAEPTRLFARNEEVRRHNLKKLAEINAEPVTYKARFVGAEQYFPQLEKYARVPAELILKPGALVLFCMNNTEQQYVNGTLGRVREADGYSAVVQIIEPDGKRGRTVAIEPANFDYQDGDGRTVATMIQLPLKLAWALTIHKSQGMTLPRLQVDLRHVFVGGHAYVALSRVQALGGLSLDRPLTRDMVEVNPAALAYYQGLEDPEWQMNQREA